MNQTFNVIWIDDEYEKMSAFQDECKIIHSINLFPFRTQKSGMEALDANIEKWDAILLDAKMLDKDENETPRLVGLRNAIAHINELKLRKNIPYFISTGQPDLFGNELFEESFSQYYIKERDDEELISDMLQAMKDSSRQQILSMYSDVVENMNSMDTRGTDIIVRILQAMHFPASNVGFDPLLHYTQLRLLMEYLFRACYKVGILPSECFPNDIVNLNQCYQYLAGRPAIVLHLRYGDEGERVVPYYIDRILSSILYFGNANSHSTALQDEERNKIIDIFNNSSQNSKYLIFGLALQMCEVIVWFGKYIENNNNIDFNKSKCRHLNNVEPIEKEDVDNEEYGILEGIKGNSFLCKVGTDYCISRKLAEKFNAIGKKVKIQEYEENTNRNSSEAFKYYIKKIKVID